MVDKQFFDIIVIGGGPGGYPAAIRAAQNGKSVALIEAKDLGGTCLNRGCIPSKTLIANADVLKRVMEAEEFGIVVGQVSFDFSKMVERKDRIVAGIRKSLGGLLQSNGITIFQGFGKITSPNTVKITGKDNAILKAGKIILATGSEPRNMKAFPFDYVRIHDSTSMLENKELPKSLAIIGGGVIGCEFASLYSALGVDVTVIEMMPSILPTESQSVSSFLTKVYKKNGIKIQASTMVQAIEKGSENVTVKLANGESIMADIALVAVGRSLNVTGLGLEEIGVKLTRDGLIDVNDKMETTVPGIYAIGDIASKWWLAHVASHQGLVAAQNACGISARMHYNAIPCVTYTDPEIASVGYSLEEAIKQGYDATIGAFPFQALGKSQAAFQSEGFAQVVISKSTKQILGAQVVGHEASTLIAEMAVAIANELTIESITETVHAHPTLAEVWLEAALMASETPLHLPPKKKKKE
ncbi:MAG: dihydrolipoyl dehydrogenase [Parachlamydiaceae bacterium]|nr:dihydrolipoyl dehydrogenase [Parachlamydiaceae bacterium]